MATAPAKQPVQLFQLIDADRNILTAFGGTSFGTGSEAALAETAGASGGFALYDALNASNLTTGTVPNSRLVGPYQVSGSGTVLVSPSSVPADICTITVPLPASASRWRIISSNTCTAFATAASGTLAAGSFTAWTAAGGTGTQITAAFAGPTAANGLTAIVANSLSTSFTSASIVIRQTVLSANAGTIQFIFTIFPIIT